MVGENQLGAQSHPVYKVYDYASAPILLFIYKLNICVDFMCSTLYTVVSSASCIILWLRACRVRGEQGGSWEGELNSLCGPRASRSTLNKVCFLGG